MDDLAGLTPTGYELAWAKNQPADPERRTSVTGSSWRYGIIAIAGVVLFLSEFIGKLSGKATFLEGVVILVSFFAIVIVIAMIIERARNP